MVLLVEGLVLWWRDWSFGGGIGPFGRVIGPFGRGIGPLVEELVLW